jgi:hypothetical protein
VARLLFLGQLFEGSTAVGRVRALESLGHEVRALEAFGPERGLARAARGLRRRLGVGPVHPVNRALVAEAGAWAPEFVWVEKGIHVTAGALRAVRRRLPSVRLIHYTCDRTAVPGNVSRDLLRALPLYDLAATTVAEEVAYLRGLGARAAVRTWHGYDPLLFRPPPPERLDPTLAARAVFVGAWEAERARTVAALADAGLPVTVVSLWKEWEPVAAGRPSLEWRRQAVYGDGYPALLASGGVALGFLRKLSRDQHTQRTFEIPASGGPLLAERTPEHLELFREGVEAEFFGTDEECVAKCRALLADPARRARLSEAGRWRVEQSGYDWASRLSGVLAALPE